jgi:ssDNA-binding replication factor A large subunit
MAKKKTKKKNEEEEFWSDEDLEEAKEEDEEMEEIDISKLKFTKLKDLKNGMTDVNIIAKVDFVGETYGKGFGEDPFAIGFLKDNTGEIKVSFWGDDIQKAKVKPKKKVRIIKASVGEYKGQLQIYPNRKIGIEFI